MLCHVEYQQNHDAILRRVELTGSWTQSLTFQEHNTSIYLVKGIKEWFVNNNILVIDRSPSSLDVNFIENIEFTLKAQVLTMTRSQ